MDTRDIALTDDHILIFRTVRVVNCVVNGNDHVIAGGEVPGPVEVPHEVHQR